MPAGPTGNDQILMPDWVPVAVRRYLDHVDSGRSIRALARDAGCHASTVLRQVRRYETRRDEPLIDMALRRLEQSKGSLDNPDENTKDPRTMDMSNTQSPSLLPDENEIRTQAPRILRRLNETGARLTIAAEMDKAVVVRDASDGRSIRTAVLDRTLAEALALKDWICVASEGRITRYQITASGRMALKRFMAEDEALRVGLGEGVDPYSEQHKDWAKRNVSDDKNKKRGIRYNAAESPLTALARRRDKDGNAFLSADLVAAGERLREDFELAQLGPRVTQNWERFLTAGGRGNFGSGELGGSSNARDRVSAALSDLGPGLGDVVLRCCCFLEGMEAVERRMGWSARSGKIVLRIALQRLRVHYDEKMGNWSPMIG